MRIVDVGLEQGRPVQDEDNGGGMGAREASTG
jgi:hypothetical protein